jgi:nicotinamidase-related amidase
MSSATTSNVPPTTPITPDAKDFDASSAGSSSQVAQQVRIKLRSKCEYFKGTGQYDNVFVEKNYNPKQIAILVIGMWNTHASLSAAQKLDEMAPRMDAWLKNCRKLGMQVIWGGSSWEKGPKADYWKNSSFRREISKCPFYPLQDRGLNVPPLPIDDSDGGYDAATDKNPTFKRSEVDFHPGVEMMEGDALSGLNKEILNYLYYKKIELLLVCGAHTNMCVLDRPYGLKGLVRYGFPCALVRDLTDSMYNPKKAPYVSHDEGTALCVDFIEKHVCPSVVSAEMIQFPEKAKIIIMDVDETICTKRHDQDYSQSTPLPEMIARANKLYEQGFYIAYWTARGCVSGRDWSMITREQLDRWGVKYHEIRTGKPLYDVWVDDKSLNPNVKASTELAKLGFN